MERIRNRVKEMRETALFLDLADDPPIENESSFFGALFSSSKAQNSYEEQETTITKTLSWTCTTYPDLAQALIFFIILILVGLSRLHKRKHNTTRSPPPTNVPATTHDQKVLSQYPPGMRIDLVQAKWRAQGMEPLLVSAPKVQMVEEPRIRRKLGGYPEGKLYKGNNNNNNNIGFTPICNLLGGILAGTAKEL
ncbi:hypothetical protein P3342_009960 [Pyrenophora teres f. teres]|nr:hypothetical protein P3342_009960 [Pyrenophora teres f. teres]